MTTCTKCDGTGFLNLEQIDDEILKRFDNTGDKTEIEMLIAKSLTDSDAETDACYCDCCDGTGEHNRDIEKRFNCM